MRRTLCLLLFAAVSTPICVAQPLTEHPVVQRITTEGFQVDDDQLVQLTPPLVTPRMAPDAQREAFADLVGSRRMDKYVQDSIVAPFKLDIKTVRKTADRASVRSLDLYFVCRGDLEIINKKDLLGKLVGGGEKPQEPQESEETEFETYFDRLGAKPDEAREPPKQGELVSSLFRYRFPILERVVISGLVQAEGLRVEGSLVQSVVTPRDKRDDPSDPTRWRAIPRGAESDAELGPAEPFQGFVCYLQATQLGFIDNAVLVECHAAYIEPYGWFNGRNILASKLPLLMQKSVRGFRRKLKESQEKLQEAG